MSEVGNQNQLFAQWAQNNLSALGHLMFYQKDGSNKDNFFQDRLNSHKSTIKKLEKFLEEVKSVIKLVKKEISRFQEIPDVEYLCYDDNETILLMRQYAFIEQLICEHSISIASRKYGYLVDLKKNAQIILSLFQDSINQKNDSKSNDVSNSKSILPENQICEIDDFIIIDYSKCDIDELEKQLRYLNPFKIRMYSKIHKRKKALWATNYQQFLSKLVNEAKSHLITELSYFKPIESEISLSRCFFCYKSPYKSEIDKIIDQFNSIPFKTEGSHSLIIKSTQGYISDIVNECCKLVGPSYEKMTPTDKSICLLLFFRCLFNRCYERYGDDFFDFQANSEKRIKMEKISKVPAHYFPIPWNLINNSKIVEKKNQDENESITVSDYIKTNQDCSIGKLFENITHFEIASDSLINSMLEPNPIDALFCIHLALIGVNKGAFANFNNSTNNSTENSNDSKSHEDLEMKQLLCFDDMFALMLGTLLGSEKPDIFFVADMIEKFAPKMSLSPSFDFALANVEGLASHCVNFNLEKCYDEINKESQKK